MEIRYFPDRDTVEKLLLANEPVLLMTAFDKSETIIGDIDEYLEHHILLEAAGHDRRDIDKFFRFVADGEGADWTFICQPDYKSISDKTRRIECFYKDGLEAAGEALGALGIAPNVEISKRYRRHFDFMNE